MRKLEERDRQFFATVARAAFANPFSVERDALDAEIAGAPADDPQLLRRLSARLAARLEKLGAHGKVKVEDFTGEDRDHVFAAVLFHVFHRYLDELDALIESEERLSQPARVRFARGFLSELAAHGFTASECVRMLELFHQVRRAHSAVQTRLIGKGPSMRKVREELWNALFTRDLRRYERYLWSRMEDFSTLLTGETGTGKGEAAAALGRSAFIAFDEKREAFRERAADMFVPIHLSEFPESLIESELFGHRKGAFTGAIEQHRGVLARVKPHGTVFLDEIGEVSLPIQVKLLRVLQEREFTPVGGHERERFLGRVAAATHRSFAALTREGRMREDFFYRLCTNTIELPSLRTRLREHPGELALLVASSCTRVVGEPSPELAREVESAIVQGVGRDYDFPGNVRELEQCVRRVLLTGHCDRAPRESEGQANLAEELTRGALTAEALVARYCTELYARTGNYVEVARVTGLDRRTVKKHVVQSNPRS